MGYTLQFFALLAVTALAVNAYRLGKIKAILKGIEKQSADQARYLAALSTNIARLLNMQLPAGSPPPALAEPNQIDLDEFKSPKPPAS
jgi:hypothetical protein